MTREGLIERISQEGCLVFGTGFVASLFREALAEGGIESGVCGYLATNPAEGETLFGSMVKAAKDPSVDRSRLVCVAVHESNLASARDLLCREGYTDVEWVYPLTLEMLYGNPLFKGVELPVEMILERQDPSHNWMAVRALASRGILEGNDGAKETYVAAMGLHCGPDTAQRRYAMLRELVFSMRDGGFDARSPILVDTNLSVIDGLHRVAVAWVLGVRRVPCDVVAKGDAFDRLLTERNRLSRDQLEKAGLGARQISAVEAMREQMSPATRGKNPEVTFIIPAYNVRGYVDQCLESVTRQTFCDFEALLIDDGSTDGTAEACNEWSSLDPRIRAIHKPNGGVSSCRNLGIELARGEYLAFVDSDDWLDERYLELLHEAAEREGALLAECDIWRYDNRTGTKILRRCGQRMGVRHTLEEHMRLGPTASYKAISRRSLWVEDDVRFPGCPFESPAVFALVVALAGERWAYVPEPLYYYRRFRPNSLVETAYAKEPGVADNTLGTDAMAHLCEQFRRCGVYEQFEHVLPGVVTYRLNDILAMQFHRRSPEDFSRLVANQRAFLAKAFPGLERGAYVTWGGYNLNRVMQHLPLLNDPSCRFNFSSVAAVAHAGENDGDGRSRVMARHANRYRQLMLQRELDGSLWQVLEEQRPCFVFMDLIDERFDLVRAGGRVLTASDAFEGATFEGMSEEGVAQGNGLPPNTQHIAFGSPEHLALWKDAFSRFCSRLGELAPQAQVVLVENYLSERVGTLAESRPFEEAEKIRETNRVLARLYSVAKNCLPEAVTIPAYACDGYFTDEAYEYGAVPQHLNDIVNERIARLIEEAIL